ncbi:hypothetical protein SK128_026983, partial [Halocaridina rubra]
RQDKHISIHKNITQHTSTSLTDVIGKALNRKLKVADDMCKKCLNLFNEKDRLHKLSTDMDNHIMNKLKDSTKKITTAELSGNGDIKEELERQYNDVDAEKLKSESLKTKTEELSQINDKKKRGRPRKVAVVCNTENKEPPPLMVNERQKRKRSEKFNSYLEVLKGEKDFYIMDDRVDEPRKRRKGVLQKEKPPKNIDILPVGYDPIPVTYEIDHENRNRMCVIQLTELNDQGLIAVPTMDKDNNNLNLVEVVEDILGNDYAGQSIEPLDHEEADLIKVINGIATQHDGRTDDEIALKDLDMTGDVMCMKKEPLDIDGTWDLTELPVSDGQIEFGAKLKNLEEESLSCSSKLSNRLNTEKLLDCKPSIIITDAETSSSFSKVEVTILNNDDDTLCAVVNNQDTIDDVSRCNVELKVLEENGKSTTENFRCKLCNKIFPSKELAREHAQTEHKESIPIGKDNGFRCKECNKYFPTLKGRARHHSQMHIKYKPVQCEECNINFDSFQTLERHLRNDHDRDPTVHCKICEAEFVLENSQKLHLKIGHATSKRKDGKKVTKPKKMTKVKSNRLYKCPFCDKQIFGLRAIKNHHRKLHNNVPYSCKFCKYKSGCLSSYDRHLVKVHKASTLQLYICAECLKGFQDPRDIEEHNLVVHNAKLIHRCPHCGEKFACIPMLRFHRKSHVAFSCDICHLGFMKEEALEDHMKTVHISDCTAGHGSNTTANLESSDITNKNEKPSEGNAKKSTETNGKEASINSKILVINSDGSLKIKEENENSVVAPASLADITLHLQQSKEGGLEEMDIFNPLKGQKLKDLPKKMSCPICNKLLTTKFLRTHMLSHKGDLPHKCKVCGKSYAQGTLLRKHMKNRHYNEYLNMGNKRPKKQKIKCEFCEEVYEDIYVLEEHLWNHMAVKKFECHDCKIKFGMERTLREHNKSHYFKEVQFCPVCKREFKSIGFYNEHVEKCEKKWKCEECGLECFSQEFYRKHQRSDHGGENVVKYQCSLCEKSFIERHCYEDHIITHSTEKSFICSICNKQFKRFRPLKDHVMRCHSSGPLTCSYCRRCFSSQEELDIHKRTHKKELSCSLCGLLYTSKEALNNHLMVNHSEEKLKANMVSHNACATFTCHVDGCQKMFRSAALLRNHVTRRHHELPYVCLVCDRKFALESDHIRHMTTHKKAIQPHLMCILCGNNFKTEALLDRHLLVHTGEKPYECGVCEHKASTRLQIVLHIEEEHEILEADPYIVVKWWRCSGCRKMFMTQASLRNHLEEHAAQGVQVEGFSVKTSSALSSDIPPLNVDSANSTKAFIEQLSALSWQDITLKLELEIISEEGGEKISPSNIWQCPGCLLVTLQEEDMRNHLLSPSTCQEAAVLHMADGLENSDDLMENNTVKQESGGETVLQLTNSEDKLHYVILQEGETSTKFETMKVEPEEQDDEGGIPVLVSMDGDSIQRLLHQPGNSDIQIVVEDTAPLKQLLEGSQNEINEGSATAGTNSGSHVQDNLQSSTSLLNGSEVLLQTADGQLLLQQTVGGVIHYRLVEGVPAASEEDESSLVLLQPASPMSGELIENLHSGCL